MPATRRAKLYVGPIDVDLDAGTASIELPGGGRVSVGREGAEVSVPNRGSVRFGGDGGSVDVDGVGRVEVGKDGVVWLPDGTVWNSRASGFPDVVPTPTPGGPFPIPYPDFTTSPLTIPIPVPNFVIEKFDIPITLPRMTAHPIDLPLPVPNIWPTSSDSAWSLPAMPKSPPFPAPHLDLPEILPSLGPPVLHVTATKAAVARAIQRWLPTVEVIGGIIHGTVGVRAPGLLRSPLDMAAAMQEEMVKADIPPGLFWWICNNFAKAWTEWFAAYSTVVQYPAFAQWPGPVAGPLPAVAQPLQAGASIGAASMTAIALYGATATLVDPTADDPAGEIALRQLTTWYASRFVSFTGVTVLANVLGGGRVPSYAPPEVPCGPVVEGQIVRSVGVLVGPNPFVVP